MRIPLVLALLLGATLTGCIGGDVSDTVAPTQAQDLGNTLVPPKPDFDFLDAIDVSHVGHGIPALHEEAFGLALVGHEGFSGFYPPTTQAAFSDIDVHGDLAVIASMTGELGVTLVDLSDRSDPRPLSFIPSAGGEWDARFSPDGQYVFFGCQVTRTTGNERYVKGDCEGNTDVHAPEGIGPDGLERLMRVVAYDVRDPEAPVLVGSVEAAAHNLWTAAIDGTTYVFTEGADILRFDPTNDPPLEVVANVPGNHDVMVEQHPITGDWLLYTGASPGVAIYDVNDPAHPSPVFEGELPGVVGWHEQTVSGLVDGRVLLATGGEKGVSAGDVGGEPRFNVNILDVTDPANPEPLSTWTLPVSFVPPHRGYAFSIHNFAFTPYGQLAIAWYHAGVWVIDLSTQARQEEPVTLAFYQASAPYVDTLPTTYYQMDLLVPNVWGVTWTEEGHLVVPDMYTGLYVLEPSWGLYPGASP